MLIAQICHYDSHFPNGVPRSVGRARRRLIWSAPSRCSWRPLCSAGCGPRSNSIFFPDRHQVHWPFLVLWAVFLPLIYWQRFRAALHLALVALLWWSLYAFGLDGLFWNTGSKIYLVQFYFLAYLGVFLLGMLFATFERLAGFARTVQRYGIFAALVSAYALTSPYIQSGRWEHLWGDKTLRAVADSGYVASTFVALALVVGLALWHRRRTGGGARPAYLMWGEALIGAIALLILANLFLGGVSGGWVALAFNLLFFVGMLWLLYAGMHSDDRFLVNLAFVFFGTHAADALLRYLLDAAQPAGPISLGRRAAVDRRRMLRWNANAGDHRRHRCAARRCMIPACASSSSALQTTAPRHGRSSAVHAFHRHAIVLKTEPIDRARCFAATMCGSTTPSAVSRQTRGDRSLSAPTRARSWQEGEFWEAVSVHQAALPVMAGRSPGRVDISTS
jgi:hypothetical protein